MFFDDENEFDCSLCSGWAFGQCKGCEGVQSSPDAVDDLDGQIEF